MAEDAYLRHKTTRLLRAIEAGDEAAWARMLAVDTDSRDSELRRIMRRDFESVVRPTLEAGQWRVVGVVREGTGGWLPRPWGGRAAWVAVQVRVVPGSFEGYLETVYWVEGAPERWEPSPHPGTMLGVPVPRPAAT